MRTWVASWVFAVALATAPSAWSQGLGAAIPKPSELIHATALMAVVPQGGSAEATVQVQVLAGWHVNGNPPSLDYLIPTQLEVQDGDGVHAGPPAYPAPKRVQFSFEAKPLAVYDGAFAIHVPLQVAAAAAPGR